MMQYKKGTFVVVPNIENLSNLHGTTQALFMWLCKYADENGQCFPSRKRLAHHLVSTVKTVDNHLNLLIDLGLITKEVRRKEGTKENMSNLYQIQVLEGVANILPHPSVNSDPTPSEKIDTVTIPNINSTHLTLPLGRGKSAEKRLLSIYSDCFNYIYGFAYKPNWGRDTILFKGLLKSYTELQVARLLIIFFNWRGMSDDEPKENAYLTKLTFPIALFKSKVSMYEAYSRNVLRENFDDEEAQLNIIGEYITNIKK